MIDTKASKRSKPSLGAAIFIYIVVAFFLFFQMGVQVTPSVIAPQLMHDLSMSAFGLGIMSGLFFLTYTAMQIPTGLLFDKYNPRMVITLSILTCAAGTLLFAVSTNIYVGTLARLLTGFGSAFAFVAVLVVTADLFPSKYFATITGITQMLAAFGAMSGQMPVSVAVSAFGWRHTMFGLAAIGGLLALVTWLVLRYERSNKKASTEMPPTKMWLAVKNIFSSSQTWMILVYSCLLWAPMAGFASLWGVPFLVSVYGLSQHTAALLCSFMWLGLAFASPILGMVSTGIARRKTPLALAALLGVIAFGGVLTGVFSIWVVGLLLFLAGAACSGQALSFSLVRENNSNVHKATAIGFNNMGVVVSGIIFQPLIGRILLFEHATKHSSRIFIIALSSILLAYIISFVIASLFIKETYCREYQEPI